ncbi:30S ribosomal protein S8e [Candidatus Woesearchaeota archaeon B3_Woes]|nr:MAG: 30S ribosomal protein S8e [Candidatus Woesearchaeota archaeon B3_Woes]
MVIIQSRSKRSSTGARYRAYRKKKLYDKGSEPSNTKVGATKLKKVRVLGGNEKVKVFLSEVANVLDPKTKTYSKAKIKAVLDNPANRHFVRRNIITKGAVIDTEKGKAKVISRPGQNGSVNAVLVS